MAAALLCTALSWLIVERQVRERTDALVARQRSEAQRSLSLIAANVDRALNRHHGIAAVLAAGHDVRVVLASFGARAKSSPLSREARISQWTGRQDLLALDKQLLAAKTDLGVDAIWVMNAAGDCVAASNFGEPTSFIGTNYADREYFQAAKDGKRGRQFAVGRVQKVPGLFYSAPVFAGGAFLGTVAIRSNLPKLASAASDPHSFVADDHGVIILSPDHTLEMRALPGTSVNKLTPEARRARYLRESFDLLDIRADSGPAALVRVGNSPRPHVWELRALAEHGVSVHMLEPISGTSGLRRDGFVAFALLSLSGTLLLALMFGAYAYVVRLGQHGRSIEETNQKLRLLNEDLDRLANVDSLTGCANRRHFHACLNAELARAARYGYACSLLIIDVDFFKRVNDVHGHGGGDEALRHLARIVQQQVRGQDLLGRLGGEEFAVLLPETVLESAIAVAERVRRAIAAVPVRFQDKDIAFTASFGVASWNGPAEAADALMQRADHALYKAKSAGRNCAISAEPAMQPG